MAKKQKTKDKSNSEDISVTSKEIIDDGEIQEEATDSIDKDIDEAENEEERIQELEEALLRSRA